MEIGRLNGIVGEVQTDVSNWPSKGKVPEMLEGALRAMQIPCELDSFKYMVNHFVKILIRIVGSHRILRSRVRSESE